MGSIGVISAGFGAHEFLSRQGIERRVHTAGQSKSMMDPFKPEKPEDIARLKSLLEQIHGNFIRHVQNRRGEKLDEATDFFTGEIWVGSEAAKLGLIDGIGHIMPVLRDRFGPNVKLRRYGVRRSVLQRFGATLATDALAGLEERAEYARFGL